MTESGTCVEPKQKSNNKFFLDIRVVVVFFSLLYFEKKRTDLVNLDVATWRVFRLAMPFFETSDWFSIYS